MVWRKNLLQSLFLFIVTDHVPYSNLSRLSFCRTYIFFPGPKVYELSENSTFSTGGNSSETCPCCVGRASQTCPTATTPNTCRISTCYLWCGHSNLFHSLSIAWVRGKKIGALIILLLGWELVGQQIFESNDIYSPFKNREGHGGILIQ